MHRSAEFCRVGLRPRSQLRQAFEHRACAGLHALLQHRPRMPEGRTDVRGPRERRRRRLDVLGLRSPDGTLHAEPVHQREQERLLCLRRRRAVRVQCRVLGSRRRLREDLRAELRRQDVRLRRLRRLVRILRGPRHMQGVRPVLRCELRGQDVRPRRLRRNMWRMRRRSALQRNGHVQRLHTELRGQDLRARWLRRLVRLLRRRRLQRRGHVRVHSSLRRQELRRRRLRRNLRSVLARQDVRGRSLHRPELLFGRSLLRGVLGGRLLRVERVLRAWRRASQLVLPEHVRKIRRRLPGRWRLLRTAQLLR